MDVYFRYQKRMKSMEERFWKNQKGSVVVLVALMLPILMGFAGLALDIGNLCVVKAKMQNAVDAAVCGGGLKLPDQSQATAQATSLITNNNFNPSTATITFPSSATIKCTMTNNVPTFFMGLLGIKTVSLTASAEGQLQGSSPGGPFNYTIFSGSETLDLLLNGSQTVTGSVHSNDHLLINGSGTITGAAEGYKGVTVNGTHTIGSVVADILQHITINGSNNIGSKSGGATDIAMPDYTQQIQSIAAQKYYTDKTFNGAVNINGSIYVQGKVTLNGSISSSGAILATGNITVNGTSSISGANQVCLYSANGDVLINGTSFGDNTSSEIVYAPNGKVTINGNFVFHGRIIAKQVLINGSENIDGGDYPVTTLPGKAHVKLIL
jgi:cytoskeletal protein CcmA (bactofilin family)